MSILISVGNVYHLYSVTRLVMGDILTEATPKLNSLKETFLQFMCVVYWAGVTYLRYTVLTSPNKDETAVHCCDPALSVLAMLESRNVFHIVSALQSLVSCCKSRQGAWVLANRSTRPQSIRVVIWCFP